MQVLEATNDGTDHGAVELGQSREAARSLRNGAAGRQSSPTPFGWRVARSSSACKRGLELDEGKIRNGQNDERRVDLGQGAALKL